MLITLYVYIYFNIVTHFVGLYYLSQLRKDVWQFQGEILNLSVMPVPAPSMPVNTGRFRR